MSRIYLADGVDKGAIVAHDVSARLFVRRTASDGALTLYRIFGEAQASSRDVCDLLAGEWCERCAMLRARCAHQAELPTRRWARFGPRFDRTGLHPDAPGSRESKWHLLRRADQAQEPWLTVCDLIVYGPIVEEYANPVLTPTDAPMCRRCKRIAGLDERALTRETNTGAASVSR